MSTLCARQDTGAVGNMIIAHTFPNREPFPLARTVVPIEQRRTSFYYSRRKKGQKMREKKQEKQDKEEKKRRQLWTNSKRCFHGTLPWCRPQRLDDRSFTEYSSTPELYMGRQWQPWPVAARTAVAPLISRIIPQLLLMALQLRPSFFEAEEQRALHFSSLLSWQGKHHTKLHL